MQIAVGYTFQHTSWVTDLKSMNHVRCEVTRIDGDTISFRSTEPGDRRASKCKANEFIKLVRSHTE